MNGFFDRVANLDEVADVVALHFVFTLKASVACKFLTALHALPRKVHHAKCYGLFVTFGLCIEFLLAKRNYLRTRHELIEIENDFWRLHLCVAFALWLQTLLFGHNQELNLILLRNLS